MNAYEASIANNHERLRKKLQRYKELVAPLNTMQVNIRMIHTKISVVIDPEKQSVINNYLPREAQKVVDQIEELKRFYYEKQFGPVVDVADQSFSQQDRPLANGSIKTASGDIVEPVTESVHDLPDDLGSNR